MRRPPRRPRPAPPLSTPPTPPTSAVSTPRPQPGVFVPGFLAGSLANVLRPITLVVTLVFFALLLGETLTGRRALDEKAAYFYLAVLTAYAGIQNS